MLAYFAGIAASLLAALAMADATPASGFVPADLDRLADVAEPEFSPDGKQIVYSVTTTNAVEDERQSDLWITGYDGRGQRRLTSTPADSEWQPSWSPDGRSIAFLSDRGGEGAQTQVWTMPAAGGEARQVTRFAAGVEDFAWAPDGMQLAVIAMDPERAPGTATPKHPPPVVIDRYQFKQDGRGYVDARHQHLYVVDVGSGGAQLLTPGEHDEQLPAWAPDGRSIAYVTKRGEDPDRHINFDIYLVEPRAGAPERQLTRFAGSDLDPYWGSRPAWSPDSKRIAYVRGGDRRLMYYAPWQLAVVDIESGAESSPAPIDRCVTRPAWSGDGRSIYALVEHSRVTYLSRFDLGSGKVEALTKGNRLDFDFALAGKRVVVLGGSARQPYELAALEVHGLRPLTEHNAWLADRRLADYEDIAFRSGDGTVIEGLLVRPIDYVAGRRYPTIVRLHGGPVYQYSHEFLPEWQAYAAAGFVVIGPNPRGSSGRGLEFSRAIFADWGDKDAQDVLAAADYAVNRGIADPERLGIGGRSYGGMLTNYVIARDGRFKAAESGAGTSNMLGNYGHDQYTREYEIELGTPWANHEAYERVSFPFLSADRISTPTQFYCAQDDFNMPCLGSEQMYQALRSRNVQTRLVLYPGENHDLQVPSYLRDRLERSLEWYRRYLRP